MSYEETRKIIEERGKTWNDFITFMLDKAYEIDPVTHYIIYPTKLVYKFINTK